MTYVPGFWSWKGFNSTVRTLMIAVYASSVCKVQLKQLKVVRRRGWGALATFELDEGQLAPSPPNMG